MSDDKKLDAPREVTPIPDMNAIKEVVHNLIQNFVKEEVSNKVTNNNMAGLTMLLMQAIDGKITMKKPEDAPKEK
jgi:hypothetical protein